ncbi:MAG: hypothetical protein ACNA7V_15110 [Bacteroidales bacterium]
MKRVVKWTCDINSRIVKIKYVALSVALTAVIALTVYWIIIQRGKYQQVVETLTWDIDMGEYHEPFFTYFLDNYEVPTTFDDYIWFLSDYPNYQNSLHKFIDPFAKEATLFYIPLHNRKNMKRESYLLVSAGIDRALNHALSESDTIYEDEIQQYFKFYNDYEVPGIPEFCVFDRLFGKKDLVIAYMNGKETFKRSGVEKIDDFDEFIQSVSQNVIKQEGTFNKRVYVFDLLPEQIIQEGSKIIMQNATGFKILFYLYDVGEVSYEKTSEQISLIGLLNSIDTSSKEIAFVLCMSS